MDTEIRNAIITSVSLDDADRGMLTGWLHLDYGGSGQGFGGCQRCETVRMRAPEIFAWVAAKVYENAQRSVQELMFPRTSPPSGTPAGWAAALAVADEMERCARSHDFPWGLRDNYIRPWLTRLRNAVKGLT